MIAVCGGCCFWLCGYAIAWSDGNSVVGWHHFAFVGIPSDKIAMAFYQMVFANTASTIVTGAVAERLNLPCYFTYGTLLSGMYRP